MLVESTAVHAIDYDPRRQTLWVTFVSGERYLYLDVPAEVHQAFLEAESKGRFFQAQIRGRYGFERLP
ncbi:KTSC domain-containing protein [Phenylobacterium sp. LjRoot225]|uniref:KTSC domain-containing protein n=1 Tax=Phenylobacterium sp. LjRoot225 TaxID=3342285 RepID=UPI003ECE568E